MDVMDILEDKCLFIVPDNVKRHILSNNKKLLNIKCLSKEELKKKLMFDLDERAIHYIMNKYNLKVDVALMYLENIYYIDDINYSSAKLKLLSDIKNDLNNNNFLIKDKMFLNSVGDWKVVVYGYDYIDNFFQKLLKVIPEKIPIEIIKYSNFKERNYKVYQFEDIDDEINFVAYSICDLIESGIDINNIKLANINDDYLYPLKRIFSFYNIPLKMEDNYLFGTEIVLLFIKILKENYDLKESLNKLTTLYDFKDPKKLQIYNKLVNICNKYCWQKKVDNNMIEIIISDLKRMRLTTSHMINSVEHIELRDNVIPDNYYVFVMNFNQGSMPRIYRNEDYITDDLNALLNIETTDIKNVIERDICKTIIKRLANAVFTYKLKTKKEEFYPSNLIGEMNTIVIENPTIDILKTYSTIQDKFNLAKGLDKLLKYDELDSNLEILYYNYPDISYKTYSNHFSGIDNEVLLNYLDSRLKLSYSSIDDYFKCAFRYYLNSIIKLKSDDEVFHLIIGNLFHYVLSFAFKSGFDFDKRWNEYLEDKELTDKEQFFLLRLRDELKFVIDTIAYQNKFSTLSNAKYEEKIYLKVPNKIDVTFSGIIDKIMYKEDDNTLISIVDYKTGVTDININNVVHGLNMQLPIYLYLVKNSHKFSNPKFIGFYLQEILHNEVYYDSKKDYKTKKMDTLKLKGYTIDEENLIKAFDSTYVDSEVIKSMKLSKNGFYLYSKILNEYQMNKLVSLVSSKIDEAATKIVDGNFDINPKRLGRNIISCEYCDFRDICYMKDSDIITLKEHKNMDFLGGENNE